MSKFIKKSNPSISMIVSKYINRNSRVIWIQLIGHKKWWTNC